MPNDQVAVSLATVRFWSFVVGLGFAAVALGWRRPRGEWLRFPGGRRIAFAALALFVATQWTAPFGRVQPGARGVVMRFGAPTGRLLAPGLYAVVPYVESVAQVNVQTNTIRFDRAQGTARDLEAVYANLAVTFHVEPDRALEVYRTLRADYAKRIVRPAVLDAWKATVAQYGASSLVDRRDDVQKQFRSEVAARIAPFGFALDAVSTERFNFSWAYAQAASEKVAAVQHALEAQQDLTRIKYESQQSVVRARSEVQALEVQRRVPFAQLVRLRQLELERKALDKWDGHLPTNTTGTPFLGGLLGSRSD